MFKLLWKISVVTVLFCGALANPGVPASPSAELERRDETSFFAAMTTLQNAATVFSQDFCCSGFTPNDTQLELIASHIKACSDAFDAALIQLASITPASVGAPLLTAADAATVNATLPSIQADILNNLNELQEGEAFFEFVNDNTFFRVMYCHWVGTLALENKSFLQFLGVSAPV
ncbi:hypothetical protein MSAN_00343600 [Mycena sanguinolenta]|uniref:Uncharacterized protein n=1 Tax=Mycena sanguinolenta TaxID=230812 RepID=A0A8H7DHJ8_9AGAR|nr:hypothetical protein MSAN_00343600 [Mycena sanguinolenta]